MMSYIKGSRTALNKVGSNNLSAPNTSIYGFKVGLQPTFPHHTKAASKHTTQTQRCVPKNSNRVVASRKALPGRCQIVVVRSYCICRLGYCWYRVSSEGWLYSSYLVALALQWSVVHFFCLSLVTPFSMQLNKYNF